MKNKPPEGRETLAFSKLQNLSLVNSKKLPKHVDIGGVRKRWVGIGWVAEGPAHGDEVIITEDDGTLPEVKVPRDAKYPFWARCQFYEPFTLGGEVWREVRYALEGYQRTAAGYKVWVTEKDAGSCNVYEAATGGSICVGDTIQKAVDTARRLIKITPDFDKQIATMTPIHDLPIVSADEALRRLNKTA